MKSFSLILAAVIMVFATACNNGGNTNNATESANNSATTTGDSQTSDNSGNATKSEAQAAMILGKLNFVNLKDGEQPVMTALTLKGNRAGSTEWNDRNPPLKVFAPILNSTSG